jgi:hypothetical protein
MSLLEPEPFKPQRPSFFTMGGLFSLLGIALAGGALYIFINQTHPFTDTSGGTLVYGFTVYDAIGTGEEDEWTFEGQEGDTIFVRMDGSFDTYLELEDDDQRQLIANDDSGDGTNARIDGFTLPNDGTYTIIARGYSGSAAGSYSLELQRLSSSEDASVPATREVGSNNRTPTSIAAFIATPRANDSGTIEYGATVSGNVTTETGDEWTFRGNEGDIVTIDMTGGFDTYLVLYDSDNRELARDDDSGDSTNARIQYYVLPYDGSYTILARGYAGRTGSYELSLNNDDTIPPTSIPTSTPAPSRAGTIEYGQTVRSNVRTEAGEFWTFRGNEDDIIVIDMVGDFDTYLLLFDSDNRELTRDDDSGEDYNARITFYTLPNDGTYTIVARGWAGNTGSYELTITTVDDIPTMTPAPTLTPTPLPSSAGSIEYGQTVDGRVNDFGGDAWTFVGERGDHVTIELDGDDFDTYLVLADSDYRELTYDDDSGDDLDSLIRDFRLPRDGTYMIVARGFFGRTGSYTLTLTLED